MIVILLKEERRYGTCKRTEVTVIVHEIFIPDFDISGCILHNMFYSFTIQCLY